MMQTVAKARRWNLTFPLLDPFGGVVDPVSLLKGVKKWGGRAVEIRVFDHRIILLTNSLTHPETSRQRIATWVRECFSPQVAVEIVERDRDESARKSTSSGASPSPLGRFSDHRTLPVAHVVLTPLGDEPASEEAARIEAEGRLSGEAGEAVHRVIERAANPLKRPPLRHLLSARTAAPLDRLERWISGVIPPESDEPPLWIDGLVWSLSRRPVAAMPKPKLAKSKALSIHHAPTLCDGCGRCARVCPRGCFAPNGHPDPAKADACLRCYQCVEFCPREALTPFVGPDTSTHESVLRARTGFLARLLGEHGPMTPSPWPASYLVPRESKGKGGLPRIVLGLSVATQQEHAAALFIDGRLVGAVEEERLNRVRHYGYHPPGRPGVTLSVDAGLTLEEALCRRSVRCLLEPRGLSLDDVDLFAVNGLGARFRAAFSLVDPKRPPPILRSGRVVWVPHHRCHAESAHALSGFPSGWVLTIDGRGDRESAALFKADRRGIRRVWDLLSLESRSVGGVYETFTRLLGFGPHGQGSLMALAALGKPTFDLASSLDPHAPGLDRVDEREGETRFASFAREGSAPVAEAHRNLAASLQAALEEWSGNLLESKGFRRATDRLSLAGGVALNCQMNSRLAERLDPAGLFIQPGANDAGTALGAALAALRLTGTDSFPPMTHALWGPPFEEGEIEAALIHFGLSLHRPPSIAETAAQALARNQVVAWAQGPMEFGPRALGARSLLGDPRRPEAKDRLNRLKERESWRPFGPSILAGHEKDWFEPGADSRFMLRTLEVRPDRRDRIPAVVHGDGSTRPQSVHREDQPLYHDLIAAFLRLSGVPMVLNTSFNRRNEPMPATPYDAIASFLALGADALAIGPFWVEPSTPDRPSPLPVPSRSRPPERKGRRLLLRVTTECPNDCVGCTVKDLRDLPDRGPSEAEKCLEEGRRAGCDELVILRGEPTRWRGLVPLIRRAKEKGYRLVQLQSNGRDLAGPALLNALLDAGLDHVELMMLGANESRHDALCRAPGAFRETLKAAAALAKKGRLLWINVPVLKGNLDHLEPLVRLAARLNAPGIQFLYPRPVERPRGVESEGLCRLSEASAATRRALAKARELGVTATTEGFPLCHLDEPDRLPAESRQDFARFRVADLHRLHEDFSLPRSVMRPDAPACRACALRPVCPRTWALYLELAGSDELRRIQETEPRARSKRDS